MRIPVLAEHVAALAPLRRQPRVDLVVVRSGVAVDLVAFGLAPVDAVLAAAVAPPVDVEPRPAAVELFVVLVDVAEERGDAGRGHDAPDRSEPEIEEDDVALAVDADALRLIDVRPLPGRRLRRADGKV